MLHDCTPTRDMAAGGGRATVPYCGRCDELVGLDGFHVIGVERRPDALIVAVESAPRVEGCRMCGVVAVGHGRRERLLHDAPCFGVPVRLLWRQRTWRCPDRGCPAGAFSEDAPELAAARSKLTVRALWWAIGQLRREHATIAGLARQLGVYWHTLWDHVRPVLEELAADESRFEGVAAIGVDEHIVRHEALLFRMEVRDLHLLVVVAAG